MARNAPLKFIDLGLKSAKEFWRKIVLEDYQQFRKAPNARTAMASAGSCWHLHDWVWHELKPTMDKADFQNGIIKDCPQLGWVRDVADASKHR